MIWYLVDNIALEWTVTGVWVIFLGEIFQKFSQFSFYLCNKVPMRQSQLLHLTKYIQTLYLQQMHKLMQLEFYIVFPWQRYIPAWTHDIF